MGGLAQGPRGNRFSLWVPNDHVGPAVSFHMEPQVVRAGQAEGEMHIACGASPHENFTSITRDKASGFEGCRRRATLPGFRGWRLELCQLMGCDHPLKGLASLDLNDLFQGRFPALEFRLGLGQPALDDREASLYFAGLLEVLLGIRLRGEPRIQGNGQRFAGAGVVVGESHLAEAAAKGVPMHTQEFPLAAKIIPSARPFKIPHDLISAAFEPVGPSSDEPGVALLCGFPRLDHWAILSTKGAISKGAQRNRGGVSV